MLALAKVVAGGLQWIQPSAWRMCYELRSGAERVATLRFVNPKAMQAVGESAEGRWRFSMLRREPSETRATAIFTQESWCGDGRLQTAHGESLRVERDLWQTRLDILSESEELLIQFKNAGLIRLSSRFKADPVLFDAPDLPWIALFGWYLVVVARRDLAVPRSGVAMAQAAEAG